MGYRWLDKYHLDSEVIETAPDVFKIMLRDDEQSERKFPLFGVSIESVERALSRGAVQQNKLSQLLQKMKHAKETSNVQAQ